MADSTCDVCCEPHNKTFRVPVKCGFCDLLTCRKCAQTYLLSIMADSQCMGCHHAWDREFVDSWCSKAFRSTEYRKHRETVLFEREKARLGETQLDIENMNRINKLLEGLYEKQDLLFELYAQYNILHVPHFRRVQLIETEFANTPLGEVFRDVGETLDEIRRLRRDGPDLTKTDQFTHPCPASECKGQLNDDWFCTLCSTQYCDKCMGLASDDHECDPENVKTMALLNKETRPCPGCGWRVQRTEGCSQMWCTNPSCHTAWDWRTGAVDRTGRIHNPHFIAFKNAGGQTRSREHGDIPCGGIPTYRELRSIPADIRLLAFRLQLSDFEYQLQWRYDMTTDYNRELVDNRRLRMSYLLNHLDEDKFKRELQRRDKYVNKCRDISFIIRMCTDTGGDMLRQYIVEAENRKEIVENIVKLIDYTNGEIQKIWTRYNCVTPRMLEQL